MFVFFLLLFSWTCLGERLAAGPWRSAIYEATSNSITLDEDLFLHPNCTDETPIVFVPCARGNFSCIDGATEEREISVTRNMTFWGTVRDYKTSNSALFFSFKTGDVFFGVLAVTVVCGNFSHTLINDSAFARGARPFVFCLTDLRVWAGADWNGHFAINVFQVGGALFTLLVPQVTHLLPIDLYYQAINSTLDCGDLPVPDCPLPSRCLITVRATDSPMFSFWGSFIRNGLGNLTTFYRPTIPRTLSTLIWISKIPPNYLVPQQGWGYGHSILSNGCLHPKCSITYLSLANSKG